MKKNRTYRTNAFLAMMLAGSFLAGTTSLASESKAVDVLHGVTEGLPFPLDTEGGDNGLVEELGSGSTTTSNRVMDINPEL